MPSKFKHHIPYEVSKSFTESKQIAASQAESRRYQHRISAVLLGNSALMPLDAVYLDGMPGGMSGYWTVLSVTHIIGLEAKQIMDNRAADFVDLHSTLQSGGGPSYVMDVELGSDVLGNTVESPLRKGVRDVAAEINEVVQIEQVASTLANEADLLALSVGADQFGAPNFSIMPITQRWETS